MDQLTPSLSLLVAIDAGCFRSEVFAVFRVMLAGGDCCLGRRTISRVWEITGSSQTQDHFAVLPATFTHRHPLAVPTCDPRCAAFPKRAVTTLYRTSL